MKELLSAGCNALLSYLLQKVTRYRNALLSSADYDDVTHTSSHAHASGLARKQRIPKVIGCNSWNVSRPDVLFWNCFVLISFQFCFNLISLCGQLNSRFVKHAMMVMPIVMTRCYQMSGSVCGTSTSARSVTCASTEDSFATESNIVTRERTRQTAVRTPFVCCVWQGRPSYGGTNRNAS